ncbi:MAG: hypothetical protein OEZ34_08900 [Spirochaetia bacterium]|nr:hypothetical protein [Spirochaetia bacterium]
MAFSQEWNSEGVYVNFFGQLTSIDLIESNSKLVGRPEYDSIRYAIVDFTNISEIMINNNDIDIATSFAMNIDSYNNKIKVAFVADIKDLQHLIEKYIEKTLILMPQAQQKLFESLSEAQTWVDS